MSDGIDQPGEVRGELAAALLVGWIAVYFCVWKGVKSVGKVFLFIILTIVIIMIMIIIYVETPALRVIYSKL